MRPRLLDLFSGAGGSARGYQRAGFYVVGVDHRPQPRYAGDEFIQGDALEFLAGVRPGEWDVIHASPPCQAYCALRVTRPGREYPDLIDATRDALIATGRPWVIENVPGAPLRSPVVMCGLALGLRVKRHRLFESSIFLFVPSCPGGHPGEWRTISGHVGARLRRANSKSPAREPRGMAEARAVMGIDWMTQAELSQAIPPAYTEWIGFQLCAELALRAQEAPA